MSFEPKTLISGVVYQPVSNVKGWFQSGVLDPVTLGDAFRASSKIHADRDAVLWLEGRLSYAELDAVTDRMAAGLLRMGLKPLDRVVFQLSNTPETLISFLACWKVGIIPICTLSAHREAEIEYLAEFGGARAHFVEGDAAKFDFLDFAKKMQSQVDSLEFIISTRGAAGSGVVRLDELLTVDPDQARSDVAKVEQDPWQVAAFQLSGGTTGVPKIIPRMHAEYVYNMRQVMQFKGWTAEDRLLVPMPFAHNLNMGCGWGPFLLSGGSVIASSQVDRASLREVCSTLHPTIIGAAKPIVMRMKADIEDGLMSTDTLREVFSTDAAEIVTRSMGVEGHHIFGMTEGTIMFTRKGDSEAIRFETCGRPISDQDEVRLLVPKSETEVSEGETGELAVRGPYTICGYYNAPERNAEAFTSDGFYRSGDLMKAHRIDGALYYSFEGRIKDVVDRAGEKVNCEEVERAVIKHPAFTDVAIVGMPCPTHGERICLYATAPSDMQLPTVDELGAFLNKQGLAIFKWPERIERVEKLPLTKVGKLDKGVLRSNIAEKLKSQDSIDSGKA